MNYVTRGKVISEACTNMIKEMYRRAQPSVDITLYEEQYENGVLDADKDRCYEWHYLPMETQRQIIEDYLEAYGAHDWLKRACEFLMQNFKEGGYRTAYKDLLGTGELVRAAEETEKLDELIGEENAEKVYKLMEDFMGFYRTNMDEHTIRSAIFKCPTSNPDTVMKKWGSDFKIDESVYKNNDDEYEYTYKDYIDGTCTGENYLLDCEEELFDRRLNN